MLHERDICMQKQANLGEMSLPPRKFLNFRPFGIDYESDFRMTTLLWYLDLNIYSTEAFC